MKIDVKLYNVVMSQPEGLPHKFYRKALASYVTGMSDVERQSVLDQRDEIYNMEAEWMELNEAVLRRLGFGEQEVLLLRDKRLDSPGVRNVIRTRAAEVHLSGVR